MLNTVNIFKNKVRVCNAKLLIHIEGHIEGFSLYKNTIQVQYV